SMCSRSTSSTPTACAWRSTPAPSRKAWSRRPRTTPTPSSRSGPGPRPSGCRGPDTPLRIALIHALRQSPPPIEAAFARLWPAAELSNLLDDSLSADLARTGHLDEAMHQRFLTLGRYAKGTGADAILFTCSAFGSCIERVQADLAPMVVHKPNQGMFAEAVARGGRIGLMVSFLPSLASLTAEFPAGTAVPPIFVEGALDALARGDGAEHDRLAAD